MTEDKSAARGVTLRKPSWLKTKTPSAPHKHRMESLLRERGLHTVCESASCPNLGRCFEHGTATFMILGDICTRDCRFCGVSSGTPSEVEPDEPAKVADAAASLGLEHVVVTSVTRDDLEDGGAGHYVRTIEAVRAKLPGATTEVLIPDFGGREESLDAVLRVVPEVLNHNVETVPRLYEQVRPQASYERSVELLRRAADGGRSAVKTGVMVGLGETEAEIEQVMRDVYAVGVSILTIGQYLQPRLASIRVSEYVTPEMFDHYRDMGNSLGLLVRAGPFVRSSFEAAAVYAEVKARRGKS